MMLPNRDQAGSGGHMATALFCLLLGLLAGNKLSCLQTDRTPPLLIAEGSRNGTAAGAAPSNPHTPYGPSLKRDQQDPELAQVLREVAINGEVMVAVGNWQAAAPGGTMHMWAENVLRAGVINAMVVALDNKTQERAESYGVRAFRMDVEVPSDRKESGSSRAISSLKFGILKRFLNLGYAVLLTDLDVIFLQNPFHHLTRDSDVEGMSDGFNNATAYGAGHPYYDPDMGWASMASSTRVMALNSGLFYLRPTRAAAEMLSLLVHRVETETLWDQALFNEVILFPSRPGYTAPPLARRVMDYMLFMNSKVLFKHLRHDRQLFQTHTPVAVHVNYHPEKELRMKAVVQRYVQGDLHALDGLPDGSIP